MKPRYTIKNPGRGTGYRMPLINDDLRIQRTPYGDSAYGELPDLIGKMEEMMQLENWKTMLDTVPVQEWPVYIEKADQRTTDRLLPSCKDKSYITNIILPYRMGKVKKNGASGSRVKLDKGIKVRTIYHV